MEGNTDGQKKEKGGNHGREPRRRPLEKKSRGRVDAHTGGAQMAMPFFFFFGFNVAICVQERHLGILGKHEKVGGTEVEAEGKKGRIALDRVACLWCFFFLPACAPVGAVRHREKNRGLSQQISFPRLCRAAAPDHPAPRPFRVPDLDGRFPFVPPPKTKENEKKKRKKTRERSFLIFSDFFVTFPLNLFVSVAGDKTRWCRHSRPGGPQSAPSRQRVLPHRDWRQRPPQGLHGVPSRRA